MPNTYYTVSISTITGASNGTGFIDATTIPQYMAAGSNPTTTTHTIAKSRGNSRYNLMVAKLGLMGNCYLSGITATGGSATASPSAFSFTLQSERGDSSLVTPDESNSGAFLTGDAAVKRCIARAMTTTWDDFAEYYDPTTSVTIQNGANTAAYARFGNRVEKITVGALANSLTNAEAVITVTKITGI